MKGGRGGAGRGGGGGALLYYLHCLSLSGYSSRSHI